MKETLIDPAHIDELLSRSISQILPDREKLREVLLSGKKIRIYIGADATGPALHIGHGTNYMILERFRKLGHKVIILIGDFTAMIGDPTDRASTRPKLTREQVAENVKTWLQQIYPLLKFDDKINPAEIHYNSEWLSSMNLKQISELSSHFTVQQVLERNMFEKRQAEGKPIYLHEFFYPLMQGYDSVALDVDVELCGTDQTFNALAGRTLLKDYKNKEKFIITTTLLENPITKEKMMSKSIGTGIYLNESAKEMRKKIFLQPKENLIQLFTDCTFVPMKEIEKIKEKLSSSSENMDEIKNLLAAEIIKIYHK